MVVGPRTPRPRDGVVAEVGTRLVRARARARVGVWVRVRGRVRGRGRVRA